MLISNNILIEKKLMSRTKLFIKNNKWFVFIIASLLVLMVVYVITQILHKQHCDIEQEIASLLTPEWTITTSENTVPAEWKGVEECTYILAENPSEKYYDFQGDFEYSAHHKFWFCPTNWDGEQVDVEMMEQAYPATLLCSNNDYQIYYLSIGQNSKENVSEDITNIFCN